MLEGGQLGCCFSGPPCCAPSSSTRQGVFSENCSSPMAVHVLCALPGRVPQRPCRGRQHSVTFEKGRAIYVGLLGRARKVASLRAAPGCLHAVAALGS